MYPTVVIILVETQRLMTDVYEISPSNSSILEGPAAPEAPATLRHLPFVVDPINSTTENEAEPQHSRALQSQGGGHSRSNGESGWLTDITTIPSNPTINPDGP